MKRPPGGGLARLVSSAKTYWETMGRFAKVSRRKRLSNNIFHATGNFADFGFSQAILRPIDEHIQIVAAKFPKQQNRDFFRKNREKLHSNREFNPF